MGTHQGAVEGDHLQSYLDEFAFRFNRRRSEFRGLLFRRLIEQAVEVGPVTYRSLIVNPVPKKKKPRPWHSAASGPHPWQSTRQSVDRGATGSGHSTQMDTPFRR